MIIETKHSVGDKVFYGTCSYQGSYIECPDCLGTKEWEVRFPDGETIKVDCQTCTRGYQTTGTIKVDSHSPLVRELTVGEVGFEDGQGRYMCIETGIGSGNVYFDKNLFKNRSDAMKFAEVQAEKLLANTAKNNFYRKGLRKADKYESLLGVIGYSRQRALLEARRMKAWIETVNNKKQN